MKSSTLRKRIGSALENWSQRRIQKVQAQSTARQQKLQKAHRVLFENQLSQSPQRNLSKLNRELVALHKAEHKFKASQEKVKRVQQRHTAGWIGKTIRKVKG